MACSPGTASFTCARTISADVAVFRRHAAPKAALMFTSGPAAGEAIGAYRGEPLYHAA
jgi:hypothetical protein